MSTFKIMFDRIVLELRRSNLIAEAKNAINDAIREAAKMRFYFNEMRGVTFSTVINQEYYSDQGLVGIDATWRMSGTSRFNLELESNEEADLRADGNLNFGNPDVYARYGDQLRLHPVPNTVLTINLTGYGKLTPFPLVADGDSNAWMIEGELYIRALAKRNLLRDVIRDYGEARVYDSIAEDYKMQLEAETAERFATGTIRGTQF